MGQHRGQLVSALGSILAIGAAQPALASGWDYDLTVNSAVSNLTFDISLDTPLGDGSDSASSAVAGTIGANLAPPPGGFNQIRITDAQLNLIQNMHFDIELNFFLDFVGDIQNASLLMDATHGGPGPGVPVTSGSFSQIGNFLTASGVVSYNAGILGSDTIDLATLDPEDADFNGTVSATASLITLTVPIDLSFDLMQDTTDLGDARIHGSIVATGVPLRIGDSDGDRDVDLNDLGNLASNYGRQTGALWQQGDFDSDGDVDLNDLGGLATTYGAGSAQAFADFQTLMAVPEPGALALVSLLAPFVLRRR